ncbi:MFS transporter [Ferrovibrio sp.]|uniref:MFS transporter n=1 Tax=Ferrovibrio sp. TaxID=1917215 RepID=UPI00261433E0|nr:MFS transporter [Ferrovibrio sp.]
MTDFALPAGQPTTQNRDIKVMALVGAAHGCSHFFQLVLPSLFPFLKDAFQVSYTELGVVTTMFYVISGLLQTPAGYLVDRIGARNVLIGGLGIFCVGILLLSLVPAYWMLFPVMLIAGLGNCVFHPADYSILSASIDPKRLGMAYGTHTFGGNIGWALAPALMGGVASFAGWHAAPAVAAVVGLGILAALVLNRDLLKDDAAATRREARSAGGSAATLGPLLTLPVMMCFIYFMFNSTVSIGLQNFLPATLQTLFDTPLAIGTMALTGFLLASAIGIIMGGWAADRGMKVEVIVMAGMLGGAALMLVVAFINLPTALLVGVISAAGFLIGFTVPSRDLIVRGATPKGASGRVFGFVYSGLDAGSAIAPLVIGQLLDHGHADMVLVFVAAVLACGTLTAITVRSRSQASQST